MSVAGTTGVPHWSSGTNFSCLRLTPPPMMNRSGQSRPSIATSTLDNRPAHFSQDRPSFFLTRAEARLALHLAAGRSLACAAEAFGVRLTTLRSQLGQIYCKTGTNRQVELVALLHRSELASSGAQARIWGDTRDRLSA